MSAHEEVTRTKLDGLYTAREADAKLADLNQRHETETHSWQREAAANLGTTLYRLVYKAKP